MAASSTAFTRASRLTDGKQFARVFSGAERSADRYFTILARPNDVAQPRIGLAISKRSAPKAVARNRLRRLAREAFRQLELPPLDFVVMARSDARSARNSALSSSLRTHFLRLGRRAGTD